MIRLHRRGVHQNAFLGDQAQAELVTKRQQFGALRALLQPDVADAQAGGFAHHGGGLRGRHADKHGVDMALQRVRLG